MRPFSYERVPDQAAVRRGVPQSATSRAALVPTMLLAGGTTLLDLMKLDVLRPERVLDINTLAPKLSAIHSPSLSRLASRPFTPRYSSRSRKKAYAVE